jgi:hypothetical protein
MENKRSVQKDLYARHGGIHFKNNVPAEQINQFVKQLPDERRDNWFEVFSELETAGMITMVNDHVFADGEGKVGGSSDC